MIANLIVFSHQHGLYLLNENFVLFHVYMKISHSSSLFCEFTCINMLVRTLTFKHDENFNELQSMFILKFIYSVCLLIVHTFSKHSTVFIVNIFAFWVVNNSKTLTQPRREKEKIQNQGQKSINNLSAI